MTFSTVQLKQCSNFVRIWIIHKYIFYKEAILARRFNVHGLTKCFDVLACDLEKY